MKRCEHVAFDQRQRWAQMIGRRPLPAVAVRRHRRRLRFDFALIRSTGCPAGAAAARGCAASARARAARVARPRHARDTHKPILRLTALRKNEVKQRRARSGLAGATTGGRKYACLASRNGVREKNLEAAAREYVGIIGAEAVCGHYGITG